MRISFIFVLPALITLTAASAQQAPTPKPSKAELVAQLRSDDVKVRSGAFESVRTDAVIVRDPEVRAALIDLLDRENHENPAESGEDEDYSMYVGTLADTVTKIVDWGSPRQVCILADSLLPLNELADHAKVAVPCLLQKYKTISVPFRGYVVAMLVQALAKGKNDLDVATVHEVQEIILSGLHDTDHGFKGDTIRALGKFGGEDMVPALRAVADAETSNDAGSRSIRRRTLEAIAAIEKRAGQPHQ